MPVASFVGRGGAAQDAEDSTQLKLLLSGDLRAGGVTESCSGKLGFKHQPIGPHEKAIGGHRRP